MTEIYQFDNTSNQQLPAQNKFKELIKKKWVLAIAAVFFLAILTLPFMFVKKEAVEEEINPETSQATFPKSTLPPQPTLTKEQQIEVNNQLKVDKSFAENEKDIKNQYPWLYNLPLQKEKYFVYFDLQKRTIVALLYPKSSDDVEQMKKDVQIALKSEANVPIEKFKIEWVVKPE